jgi:FkbM family methyltransferase
VGHPLLERFPQARRLTRTRPVQRALLTGRSLPLVRERGRFALGELRGGSGVYRLAADPARRVVLRHQTEDVGVLGEIFGLSQYAPPAAAAAALAAISARRPLRVLDLGGNIGLFGVDALSRYPGAQVTSYEPDPHNLAIITRCRAANNGVRWEIVEACATTADGTVAFQSGQFGHSHVSSTGLELPSVDIVPRLRKFDYVKIDIEGAEWPIITDPRWPQAMQDTTAMIMEWHERSSPAGDARTAALAAVERAGFEIQADAPSSLWDHGLVWGWRAPR